MKLMKGDERSHPRLYHYVKDRLPTVLEHRQIANALVKYAEMPLWQVKETLKYGTPPQIQIVSMPTQCFGHYRVLHGSYRPMEGIVWNWININKLLVSAFEREHTGRLAQIVGVTLLHEMVHWADHRDGRRREMSGELDAGDQFEMEAYGRLIYWDDCRVLTLPPIQLVP